jgi:hypothetical protein
MVPIDISNVIPVINEVFLKVHQKPVPVAMVAAALFQIPKSQPDTFEVLIIVIIAMSKKPGPMPEWITTPSQALVLPATTAL